MGALALDHDVQRICRLAGRLAERVLPTRLPRPHGNLTPATVTPGHPAAVTTTHSHPCVSPAAPTPSDRHPRPRLGHPSATRDQPPDRLRLVPVQLADHPPARTERTVRPEPLRRFSPIENLLWPLNMAELGGGPNPVWELVPAPSQCDRQVGVDRSGGGGLSGIRGCPVTRERPEDRHRRALPSAH